MHPSVENQPLVSIGVPCYNSSETIQRTLDSIQAQNYKNIELIISDNCSTDSTRQIIESNESCFANVKLLWQPMNKGMHANFLRAIELSSGDYFLFLAADDYLGDSSTIEKLVSCIIGRQNCIAAMPTVYYLNAQSATPSLSTRSITGSHIDRVLSYLQRLPNDNPQFYSLYQRKVLLQALKKTRICHGSDWITVLNALVQGEIIFCPESTLYRETTLTRSYADSVNRDNRGWITFGQPMLPFILQATPSIPKRHLRCALPELRRINRSKREEYQRLA